MRKQIRDAVQAALQALAALTTAEIGRRHDFNDTQLPAAAIYTDDEESERITLTPCTVRHNVELIVRLTVKPAGGTRGEDETDTLITAIDAAVGAALGALSGIFDVFAPSRTAEGNGDADADYLQTTRTYHVEYHAAE